MDRARKAPQTGLGYSLAELRDVIMITYERTTPNTRRNQGGFIVIRKTILCTAVVGVSALTLSSTVAQANPSTPMSVIEASAAQLCGAVDAHPTTGGVIDAMTGLDGRGLDEVDAAMVLITAMHHVCPQHATLLMGTIDPIAADELCTRQA